MNGRINKQTDVLVIGTGMAGIMAAINSAKEGAKTILVTSANLFSGSSFYPGTWGLGLVGPENENDKEDLIQTILEVGMGMADEKLVSTFVQDINSAVMELENYGVKLKEAKNLDQKEFIPCFDHKTRDWHGIVKEDAKDSLKEQIDKLEIQVLEYTNIIKCLKEDGKIHGVCAVQNKSDFFIIKTKAIVMATGGLGGLFLHSLNTDDVTSVGHYMALELGATLKNLEFIQMMPGYLSPCPKTIFNERVFKYSIFTDLETGEEIFQSENKEIFHKALEIRSTHGPFTSRLDSKLIDFKIFESCRKHLDGVTVCYSESLKANQPEFIRVYFDWLLKEKKLTIDDKIQLGIFYHAANGGIKIDSNAFTGVNGFYACGEVTGGMHGADRIGGLSTANGLVFGRRAGKAAAHYALSSYDTKDVIIDKVLHIEKANDYLQKLKEINFKNGMIFREGKHLVEAIENIRALKEVFYREVEEISVESVSNWMNVVKTYELQAHLVTSEAFLRACQLRKESRGSHYRVDYPEIDITMNQSIVVNMRNGLQVEMETK